MAGCDLREYGYFNANKIDEPKKWFTLVNDCIDSVHAFQKAVEKKDHKKLRKFIKKGLYLSRRYALCWANPQENLDHMLSF